MAGGTFSLTETKVRPGLYINFESAADMQIKGGANGVVAMPVKASWGPIEQMVEIASEADLVAAFGATEEEGATALPMIRRVLKGSGDNKPSKVLAYRLADGTEAAASVTLSDGTTDVLTLTAKYKGVRANDFSVSVKDDVSSSDHVISLFENGKLLHQFTAAPGTMQNYVDAINNDAENVYVVASSPAEGTGELALVEDDAATPFAGGVSGVTNVLASDYDAALSVFETYQFSVFVLDGITDSGIHTSVRDWTIRLRNEGQKVISVFGGSTADDESLDTGNSRSINFNHEGIVNLATGVIDLDGNVVSSADFAPWAAGVIAGTPINKSTTYVQVPDVKDVSPRLKNSDIQKALQAGSMVLVHNGSHVVVEQGINTLTSLSAEQSEAFKKIRVVRTLDAISNDITKVGNEQFIGKVNNDASGRASFRAAVLNYFETLANARAIQPQFLIEEDPNMQSVGESAYFVWSVQPIDSLEKIYNTVKIG